MPACAYVWIIHSHNIKCNIKKIITHPYERCNLKWDELPEELQGVLSVLAVILALFALDTIINVSNFFSNNPIYLWLIGGVICLIGTLKFLDPFNFFSNSIEIQNKVESEIIDRDVLIKDLSEETIDETNIRIHSISKRINQWKKVSPNIRGKRKERQLTLSMTGYLASSYPNISHEERLGSNRIDAVIDDIGIEAKHRPNQNEINRLYGQVDDYLRHLSHVIVVFFDTNQTMINNFNKKLRTGNYHKKVTVIAV